LGVVFAGTRFKRGLGGGPPPFGDPTVVFFPSQFPRRETKKKPARGSKKIYLPVPIENWGGNFGFFTARWRGGGKPRRENGPHGVA